MGAGLLDTGSERGAPGVGCIFKFLPPISLGSDAGDSLGNVVRNHIQSIGYTAVASLALSPPDARRVNAKVSTAAPGQWANNVSSPHPVLMFIRPQRAA